MSLLLESIRFDDGAPQELTWHQRRLDATRAELFPGAPPLSLAAHLAVPDEARTGVHKCRVLYRRELESVTFHPWSPRIVASLQLVEGGPIDYRHKRADRSALQALFFQRGRCDDIIIVRNGEVTDASSANLAFYDGQDWWTPIRPLLHGTTRARLLWEGRLRSMIITPAHLSRFSQVSLINAMLDLGRLQLPVSAIAR